MPSSTPLCRCRVLYIGSAVPTVTKDGLQGIQEPLRERYPIDTAADAHGIDSWLSVWSNGLLLEYVDGDSKTESAFFPIQSLHYCAAVRYVNVAGYEVEGGGERFLPLDSPFANLPDSRHPPIFAAIFRRTTGVKVLECHSFICTNARAANALVRCCFHSYADSMHVKMEEVAPFADVKAIKDRGSSRSTSPRSDVENGYGADDSQSERDVLRWSERAIGRQTWQRRQQAGDYETASISSSVGERYKKKSKPVQARASSELGGTRGALVPYNQPKPMHRRSGSDVDLRGGLQGRITEYGTMPRHAQGMPPPGMPHHPGMMPPPPMMPMPMYGPPPPAMFPGGPQAMRHPPPPPPPMFAPPPHVMMMMMMGGHPPPRDQMPPYGPPMPPPPPPQPYVVAPPDSTYGSLPRGARSREEPIYMPGAMLPPHMAPPAASYHPAAFPQELYEQYYYDTFQRRKSPTERKERRRQASTSSSRRQQLITEVNDAPEERYWETFESGIYRKPYLNERAFGESTSGRFEPRRPATPPADYEANGALHNGRVDGDRQYRGKFSNSAEVA